MTVHHNFASEVIPISNATARKHNPKVNLIKLVIREVYIAVVITENQELALTDSHMVDLRF